MSIVKSIREEVAEMKLRSHLNDTAVSADHIRVMEILERQATIIEILGELVPENLNRFRVENWKP